MRPTFLFFLLAACTSAPSPVPVADILAPGDGSHHESDEPVLLAALVFQDHQPLDSLQVRWTSSIDGLLPLAATPDAEGVVAAKAWLSPGHHLLTLVVEDRAGRLGEDRIHLQVLPGEADRTCTTAGGGES